MIDYPNRSYEVDSGRDYTIYSCVECKSDIDDFVNVSDADNKGDSYDTAGTSYHSAGNTYQVSKPLGAQLALDRPHKVQVVHLMCLKWRDSRECQ